MNMIMTGNPIDGYRFIGPFDTPGEAVAWATDHCADTWWPCVIETPKEFEGN
jgi:hypothetical protein